jgi:hypothetical protein
MKKKKKIWQKYEKFTPLKVKSFFILGSLDNSEFLEILTLLPLFNDRNNSWVDKRHSCELDEKKLHKKSFE